LGDFGVRLTKEHIKSPCVQKSKHQEKQKQGQIHDEGLSIANVKPPGEKQHKADQQGNFKANGMGHASPNSSVLRALSGLPRFKDPVKEPVPRDRNGRAGETHDACMTDALLR